MFMFAVLLVAEPREAAVSTQPGIRLTLTGPVRVHKQKSCFVRSKQTDEKKSAQNDPMGILIWDLFSCCAKFFGNLPC